jgi:hypothetical protein
MQITLQPFFSAQQINAFIAHLHKRICAKLHLIGLQNTSQWREIDADWTKFVILKIFSPLKGIFVSVQ